MQVNDTLTSEDAGLQSSKNCTEPGNSNSFAVGSGCHFFWLCLRKGWMPCFFPFEFESRRSWGHLEQASKKLKGEIPGPFSCDSTSVFFF